MFYYERILIFIPILIKQGSSCLPLFALFNSITFGRTYIRRPNKSADIYCKNILHEGVNKFPWCKESKSPMQGISHTSAYPVY